MNTKFRHTIENNFNGDIIYTSSSGKDLKIELMVEARKYNKEITDFKITVL